MELDKIIKKMMVDDPFYGFMLTTIDREFTDKVPTLAVVADNRMVIRMLINKQFFESLSETEQAAVLKHELLHVAFKHLLHWKFFPTAQAEILRYAHDIEVNCYIKGLPQGCLTHTMFGFPEQKGTVFYYKELLKIASKLPPGLDTLDDHTGWKEADETASEIVSCAVDDILRRSAASVKSRGLIPSELSEIIEGLDKPAPAAYDWKREFRRFLGNSYSENKKSSRRKESRRFVGNAGTKHLKRSRLAAAIDTSGSVSQEELGEFFNELTYVYKAGAVIDIIEFDATIQRIYPYKKNGTREVKGRGGTDFGPVIKYYKEHYRMYDTLIMFTDGGAPVNYSVPQNNMLWVISSAGSKKEYPGKTIYIPKQPKENE